MGEERRRFPRIQQTLTVQCRPHGSLAASWRPVTMVNISAVGIRLLSEQPLESDETFDLQVTLPGSAAPLLIQGRAAWTRMQASGVTESGVEFVNMTSDQQAQIDTLVQFLSRRT